MGNEKQTMMVDEALELIGRRLGEINVPIEMTEQIALPLLAARKDLAACVIALRTPAVKEPAEDEKANLSIVE